MEEEEEEEEEETRRKEKKREREKPDFMFKGDIFVYVCEWEREKEVTSKESEALR